MTAETQVRSPKLTPNSDRWYRYYAGFSQAFVDDVFDIALDVDSGTVLDPWMGSGTTLAAGAARGMSALGFDLNPAMVVVAKGRLIAADTESSLSALGRELARKSRQSFAAEDDPLRRWFDAESARHIRGLRAKIDTVLTESEAAVTPVNNLSSLAAFFYVALFEAVGGCLRSFGSKNPTWLKQGQPGKGTLSVEQAELVAAFTSAVDRLAKYLGAHKTIEVVDRDRAVLLTGDSREIALDDNSVDATLTSPPYLTRLDYVVGHRAELAVLGVLDGEVSALRNKMIGTPTMSAPSSDRVIGSYATQLLEAIKNHDSYAAKSYYEPNFRQYFEGMASSLAEIDRVSKAGASVVLVVQDSWFKGIHVDLAAAIQDMASEHDWTLRSQIDFVNVRSMLQVNPHASSAAKATKPIESALFFETNRGS